VCVCVYVGVCVGACVSACVCMCVQVRARAFVFIKCAVPRHCHPTWTAAPQREPAAAWSMGTAHPSPSDLSTASVIAGRTAGALPWLTCIPEFSEVAGITICEGCMEKNVGASYWRHVSSGRVASCAVRCNLYTCIHTYKYMCIHTQNVHTPARTHTNLTIYDSGLDDGQPNVYGNI